MSELVRYEAARTALAEAHRVDEVKDIRDKAVAMQAYAKQAKDGELLGYATDIRLRAERRSGELLIEMAANGERQGDGKPKRSHGATVTPKLSDLGVTKTQSSRWQRLAELSKEIFDNKVENIKKKTLAAFEGDKGRPPGGGGSVEWYTPAEYIERAREVLGEIDLDPASSIKAQETVKAKAFYTLANDGLMKPWGGRVWLNPPYSQPSIQRFADKMIASLAEIEAAIVLTNNSADTEWFQSLAHEASAISFTRGRINFNTSEGEPGMPMQGQAFFYFGPALDLFIDKFSSVGVVMVRP